MLAVAERAKVEASAAARLKVRRMVRRCVWEDFKRDVGWRGGQVRVSLDGARVRSAKST